MISTISSLENFILPLHSNKIRARYATDLPLQDSPVVNVIILPFFIAKKTGFLVKKKKQIASPTLIFFYGQTTRCGSS